MAPKRSPALPAAVRYLLPLSSIAVALITQELRRQFLPNAPAAFAAVYAIVTAVCAWWGGYIPGLISCVLPTVVLPLALGNSYLPIPTLNLGALVQLTIISLLVSRMAQTQQRTEKALRENNLALDRKVQERMEQLDVAVERLLSEIAGHQKTEAALQESEDRVAYALEAAELGRLDLDLKTGLANRSLRHDQIFGYEKLQPQWTYDMLLAHVVPEDRDLVSRQFEALKSGASVAGVCDMECRITRKDGEVRWIFLRGRIRRRNRSGSEDNASMLGMVADITDRKLAEEKLRRQLERMSLLDQITRAIGDRQDLLSVLQVVAATIEDNLPVDLSAVCLYDAAAEKLSVAAVGIRGRELAPGLGMMPGAEIAIDTNGLSHCVRGKLVHERDLRDVAFPFPERMVQGGLLTMVAAPLLVESKVFGVLIAARRQPNSFSSPECEFLRQVSEHVALAANQAQVYSALHKAYDELRQSQQTVMQQERLRALGQMASGIAHDINNAISPVAMYTESLLETEPNLSERARDYLTTMQRAIGDVAQTVSRMGEFYRRQDPQLSFAPVDLGRLVQQVVDLTRARWSDIPQRNGVMIQLRLELAPGLPPVAGIASEIREALTNLVFNALDAMPEGGTLTLRTRGSLNGWIDVEVSDTGFGMDEETRRRCLEPFFTTKGERGTGLGLAMVYGIVQRHNGQMEIDSELLLGTTVRMKFPRSALTEGAAKPVTPVAVPVRMRILVVDDDPMVIKSLCDTLEFDGHLVVAARGGKEGIETFRGAHERGERFASVITDLGMPDVDGRKVAAGVKAISPATPIILLTGWGQRLVAEEGLPENVDFVLNKPPKLRELRSVLAGLTRGA